MDTCTRSQALVPRRKGRTFASACLTALVLFALINVAVGAVKPPAPPSAEQTLAKQSGAEPRDKSFTGWTAKAYVEQQQAPDIVVLGSSLMGTAIFVTDAQHLKCDIDCVLYRRCSALEAALRKRIGANVRAFNWSVGGEMMSDMYMINSALFRGRLKPKAVVVEVSPRDFIDNTLPYAGSTELFRFLARYVNLGDLASDAFPDLIARLEWEFDRLVPLRRFRFEGFQEPEIGDTDEPVQLAGGNNLAVQAMFSIGKVRRGQWVVPPNVPNMFKDNTKEYQKRFRNPETPLYAVERRFFERLLADLQASGIKAIVVSMPTLWPNRKLLPDSFWIRWRGDVRAACRKYGAAWLDLSDSPEFTVNDYLDTVHMNAAGGAKLFGRLAEAVAENPEVASVLAPAGDSVRLAGQRAVPH